MTYRFGDIVTIPKAPEKGRCVILSVHHSSAEGTVLMLRRELGGSTFFTRAINVEEDEPIE